MAKIGRPTKYNKCLAKYICQCLEQGQSLLQICKKPKIPHQATIYRWLHDPNKSAFCDSFSRACTVYWQQRMDSQVARLEDIDVEALDYKIAMATLRKQDIITKTEQWHAEKRLEAFKPSRGIDAGILVNNLVIIANLDGKLNSRLGIGDTPLLPEK